MFVFLRSLLRRQTELAMENLALRQQLSVLKATAKRPKLNWSDRAFWSFLSRFGSGWSRALAIVQPEAVIGWHRMMFKFYWTWKSKRAKHSGRPKVSADIRKTIARMTRENPTWGAPRVQKEMALLGYEVSESTICRCRDRSTKPPSQTWRTFLDNHMNETVSVDFFIVPAVSFNALYVFVIFHHARREILNFNITANPTAEWAARMVKQAFPWDTAPRFLLRDNDKIYGHAFTQTLDSMEIEEVRITPYSPWQNPYVERVIGTIRRDCLDHIIVINEEHLYRVLSEYVRYYNNVRCHESLDGNSPFPREKEMGSRWIAPPLFSPSCLAISD